MSLNMFHVSVHEKCSCTLGVDFCLSIIFNLKKKIIQKSMLTLRKIFLQMKVEPFLFYRTHSPSVFIALPRNSSYSITFSSYNFFRRLK